MASPSPHPEKHQDEYDEHENRSSDASTSWITSPMQAWNEEVESFSPRHEASTLELFFDLFFVANLATFTQYHAITNRYTFWSYVAFFSLLWTTWFHIVCFDARFAADSVWERACKTVHFCVFAGFALVGYKFMPLAKDVQTATPHWIYRILCWTLFLSRFWLGLQYFITAIFCTTRNNRHLRLTLPLLLNTSLFFAAAAVFGGLWAGFADAKSDLKGVIIALYVVMVIEVIGTLGISCIWRRLSFKATHIGERLGLLGLIIIGEGVIGTTKTIGRTMGKNGFYVEGAAQVFCIILILLFMWILYFDNIPAYRFGTIAQQFWMVLHLPLHLAVLGVVEGAQHLAQARYIVHNSRKLIASVYYGCVGQHLDGHALALNLTKQVQWFKLNETADSNQTLNNYVYPQIYLLGNQSNICSPPNTTDKGDGLSGVPPAFLPLIEDVLSAMFRAFGLDIPDESKARGIDILESAWEVVYIYFWSALLLLLLCYTASSLLADKARFRHPRHLKLAAIGSRGLMIAFSITVLVVGVLNKQWMYDYLQSAWILPTVVLGLWTICLGDRFSRWRRRRGEKRYSRVSQGSAMGGAAGMGDEEGLAPGVQRRGTNVYGYPTAR